MEAARPMQRLLLLLGLLLSRAAAGANKRDSSATQHIGTGQIVPALEKPRNDDHFFKHDYPSDLSPASEDEWSHPFPLVQDTKDYDKDFVKDENYDSGAYKYQMEFDTLRSRLAKARAAREVARKRITDNERDLDATHIKEEEVHAKVEQALEAKTKAEELVRNAEAKAEELVRNAEARRDAQEGRVSTQERSVEQEAQDLEDCQKELAAARAHLEDLQGQRAKAEERTKAIASEESAAEAKQLLKEKVEAEMQGKVEKASEKYDAADRRYHESVAEEDMTEWKLKESETQLRHYRHPDDHKAFGAMTATPSSLLIVVALITTLLAVASP